MPVLDFDTITGAADLGVVEIEVPEWGGHVLLRPMTAGDLGEYEQFVLKAKETDNLAGYQIELLGRVIVDEAGRAVFDTAEKRKALAAKSSAVVGRLYDQARRICGLGDEAVEDAVKN